MNLQSDIARRAKLNRLVVDMIRDSTGLAIAPEALERPIEELGVDSMILVEILYAIEDELGQSLDGEILQDLIEGGSIRAAIDGFIGMAS